LVFTLFTLRYFQNRMGWGGKYCEWRVK
jgi:hypothetical protein